MIDLRLGDWRDVLADVECDALVTDPPYGARTHAGHNARRTSDENDPTIGRDLSYSSWSPDDVAAFVESWAPRVRGWFCAMTSHDLFPAWETSLRGQHRYVFAPLPCVLRGMTVRLRGDGPSSWAVWLVVARPTTKAFASWGTLPGAYVTPPNRTDHIGGKPLSLMSAIIRDYTRPGDLVCDPCAGGGTTLQAAIGLGRRAVGAEIDPDTHAKAVQRLERGQMEMTL